MVINFVPLNNAIGLRRDVPLHQSRAGGDGDRAWWRLLGGCRGLGVELTQGASTAAQETGASLHPDRVQREGSKSVKSLLMR